MFSDRRLEICDLCGSSDSRVLYSLKEFAVRQCRKCRLVWRSPQTTVTELGELYRSYDFAKSVETQRQLYQRKRLRSYERMLAELERIAPSHDYVRLLDVGCGYGWFLQASQNAGYQVYGIEPSPHLAAQAAAIAGHRVTCGLFEHAQYPEESFDIAALLDVLEHMASPTLALTKVVRLLRPGGVALIRVPDISGLFLRAMGLIYHFSLGRVQHPIRMLYRYHTFGFSRITLCKYLAKAGLEVVHLYGEESKDLDTLSEKPWARNPLVRLGIVLLVRTSMILNTPDEMLVFARKPIRHDAESSAHS